MNMRSPKNKEKGFTLIELLIVIGIIGFLAAAVLVAVDPVKRIQDARDARRFSEANALLNAILNKQVDDRTLYNGGPGSMAVTQAGTSVQVIVSSTTGIVCNAAATRPGCNKTLDTTAANRNCVVNFAGTGAGSGTATSGGTAVTGSGTFFTTELAVGDAVTSNSTGTCTVASITSDTAFTCSTAPGTAFAGTYTAVRTNSELFPTYIASVPTDPAAGTPCAVVGSCTTQGALAIGPTNSGYYLARTAGNRLEVGACKAEQTATISVKR